MQTGSKTRNLTNVSDLNILENRMKKPSLLQNWMIMAIVAAMLIGEPSAAFAFGSKAPNTVTENKSAYLEQALRNFNTKYADITIGEKRTNNNYGDSEREQLVQSYLSQATGELCNNITPVLPPGSTCNDLVQVNYKTFSNVDSTYKTPTANYLGWCAVTLGITCFTGSPGYWSNDFNSNSVTSAHAQFTAVLTDKGAQIAHSTFFNDPSNTTVEYNVQSIQTALMNLQLLPAQRKALDGFWNAAQVYTTAINHEKAKSARGEKSVPLTHRMFVEQANLLVAYYRYSKNDLNELANFGSAAGGVSQINKEAVQVIANSIQHLIDAYGLDTDVSAKQVADYGRVLLDLLNNFGVSLTVSEKAQLQPIMMELVSKVVPMSEAYGDTGARNAVLELKGLWESDAFNALLTDKLSVSDERTTALILNMSAAAYKIGLLANVDIKTFDARDAERIKLKRFN
jgi:hypothetical protein